jgi:hypothetical protein
MRTIHMAPVHHLMEHIRFVRTVTGQQHHFFLLMINNIADATTMMPAIPATIKSVWSIPPDVEALGVTLTSVDCAPSPAAFTALTL